MRFPRYIPAGRPTSAQAEPPVADDRGAKEAHRKPDLLRPGCTRETAHKHSQNCQCTAPEHGRRDNSPTCLQRRDGDGGKGGFRDWLGWKSTRSWRSRSERRQPRLGASAFARLCACAGCGFDLRTLRVLHLSMWESDLRPTVEGRGASEDHSHAERGNEGLRGTISGCYTRPYPKRLVSFSTSVFIQQFPEAAYKHAPNPLF